MLESPNFNSLLHESLSYEYSICSGDGAGCYDNSLNQVDMIQVAEGKVIKIEFTAFDVEWCPYDHLTILDSDGTALLDKACGIRRPFVICSQTNKVYFTFITDCSVTRPGWRAVWSAETECPVSPPLI